MNTFTWKDAIRYQKFPMSHKDYDSYREGFRSGWLDRYLENNSIIAKTSPWGQYAMGYIDGQVAWDIYTSPLKIEKGGVICLTSLLA